MGNSELAAILGVDSEHSSRAEFRGHIGVGTRAKQRVKLQGQLVHQGELESGEDMELEVPMQ